MAFWANQLVSMMAGEGRRGGIFKQETDHSAEVISSFHAIMRLIHSATVVI